MDETIEQLEAVFARYAARREAGDLPATTAPGMGDKFFEETFGTVAAYKEMMESASQGKHRAAARKEYEKALRLAVHHLRRLYPGI